MILPSFLVVGAQKCGTTSVHDILSTHPEANMSNIKEINFFTNKEKYKKGLEYYSRFFEKKIGAGAVGESSPGYICFPGVPEKIKKNLGKIKILILLRNPIKRAFSQYWDNRRSLNETLTTEAIIDEYLEDQYDPARKGYFSRGVYVHQVQEFFDLFGRDNVKVVFLEELVKNQKETLRSIYTFLNLDEDKGCQKLPKAQNSSEVYQNPFYRFVFERPNLSAWIPKRLKRLFFFGRKSPFKYPMPEKEVVNKLKEFYKPYDSKLESLLGRKLPW